MQSHAYSSRTAGGSAQPSYPPVAPSSPYYQQNQPQRRYSAENNYPPSQAGSSRSAYGQSSRSPLSAVPQHIQNESDEYEERRLGEIAAANQAAQEQHWGPHTALSEAPARHELYQDQNYMDRHYSMPLMPSYEPAHYDGGIYMQPIGMYEATPQYHVAPSQGAPSMASSQTLGGRSRQSLPVYASPSMHYSPISPISPASEPPNMFNVTAAHHMPGGWPGAQDPLSGDPGVQHGERMGDPLPGFPNWSQTWYGGHLSPDGHAYTMVPPQSGQSGWETETLSHGRYGPAGHMGAYGANPYDHTPMQDHVKEERIRMLEKEFGPKVKHKGKRNTDGVDELNEEPEVVPIGGVNEKGRLVLPWSKTRTTTRWLQCLVSLTGAGCGIGGFLFIHPKDKAPPSGTMPSFVLYGVSAVSTIACLWLFLFKPCCKPNRGISNAGAMGVGGGANGMVIPVMTGGGAGAKPGLFGKKGKNLPQGTTVNLIVEPSLLGKHTGDSDSDSDEDDASSEEDRKRSKRKARKQKRLGMLETMKRQAKWQAARTSLKWDCGWDVVLCLLWGAAAVMAIGVGKKCPSGSAEGWCNLYNGAIACAVIATLLGCVAIFCDITGLQASKAPPKSRA